MIATVARALRAAYRIANRGPRWASQLTPANIVTAGLVLATTWAFGTGRIPREGLHDQLNPLAQGILAIGVIVGFVGFIIAEVITTSRRTRRAYQLFMLPGMDEMVTDNRPFRRWVIDNALEFDPAKTGAMMLTIEYQLDRLRSYRQARRRLELIATLVPFMGRWCRV